MTANGGSTGSFASWRPVIVSRGSTTSATARAVLAQFTHHVVKHAKILGFACTRSPVSGLARCVKGATTITDKLVRRF